MREFQVRLISYFFPVIYIFPKAEERRSTVAEPRGATLAEGLARGPKRGTDTCRECGVLPVKELAGHAIMRHRGTECLREPPFWIAPLYVAGRLLSISSCWFQLGQCVDLLRFVLHSNIFIKFEKKLIIGKIHLHLSEQGIGIINIKSLFFKNIY